MNRIYLATRYSANADMRAVRDILHSIGYVVTSRWIDCHPDVVGDFSSSFTVDVLNERPEDCAPLGQHDLDDIDASDTVISFTQFGGGKGGRHVEFGYALAKGKQLILIGPRENVFHTHASVEHYPDWATFVSTIAPCDPKCNICGLDNRNKTHDTLELVGHLSHGFQAS